MSGGAEAGHAALDLADAAFERRDIDGLVAHLSAAVRAFTAADDKPRAAMACVRLGDVLANAIGNLTGFVGTWALGAIKQATGSYPLALLPLVALAAVASVAVLAIGRGQARAVPAE